MKKLFFCAAALLAAISCAACSDDEEPNLPIAPGTIAGTWQITHEQGWCTYDDGEESGKETWSDDYPDEDGYYWTYTFNQDGTGQYSEYRTGTTPHVYNITYSISGNNFMVENSPFLEPEDTYEIKKLTESQLVLVRTYKGETELEESTETYKRIQ